MSYQVQSQCHCGHMDLRRQPFRVPAIWVGLMRTDFVLQKLQPFRGSGRGRGRGRGRDPVYSRGRDRFTAKVGDT